MIVKSYLYIVKHRHILEQTDVLECAGNSCFVDINGAFSRDILPSRRMIPSVGLYTPVRRLNTVVFPAPFGR